MHQRFNMTDAKLGHWVINEITDMSKGPYASAVGCLMYAIDCTRLDLAHEVSRVSKYMTEKKLFQGAFGAKCSSYLPCTSMALSFPTGRLGKHPSTWPHHYYFHITFYPTQTCNLPTPLRIPWYSFPRSLLRRILFRTPLHFFMISFEFFFPLN